MTLQKRPRTDSTYDWREDEEQVRVRAHIRAQGAIPNIPNKANRKNRARWTKAIYRERNHVERFFCKLKQFRRIATRYDKLGATFFAFVQLASVRIWLRSIESTS